MIRTIIRSPIIKAFLRPILPRYLPINGEKMSAESSKALWGGLRYDLIMCLPNDEGNQEVRE
jgi:hypothetical protein